MKIKEIKLSNFRLLRHEQTIKFKCEKGKPLTIIRAENRTGKTTLLTAIQWCLYGDKVLADSKQSLTGGDLLLSLDTLRSANTGDKIKTTVELILEYEGQDLIIQRTRETIRAENEADSVASGPDSFT
ncbi:AAA family ATPase, partial [Chloroflexota bacterium]